MKRAPISAICSGISAPDRSRDIAYIARTRSSRSRETRAWNFSPAVSWPISSATTSMMKNVSRYWASDTLKEKRGGT